MSGATTFSEISRGVDLGLTRESQLLSRVGAQGNLQGAGKIEKASRDFESILLGHWLEEAQESLASAPGGSDDDDADPARFQLQGMGMQSLATAITKSGGIGIAALIRRELNHLNGQTSASSKDPAPDVPNSQGPAEKAGLHQQINLPNH